MLYYKSLRITSSRQPYLEKVNSSNNYMDESSDYIYIITYKIPTYNISTINHIVNYPCNYACSNRGNTYQFCKLMTLSII